MKLEGVNWKTTTTTTKTESLAEGKTHKAIHALLYASKWKLLTAQ